MVTKHKGMVLQVCRFGTNVEGVSDAKVERPSGTLRRCMLHYEATHLCKAVPACQHCKVSLQRSTWFHRSVSSKVRWTSMFFSLASVDAYLSSIVCCCCKAAFCNHINHELHGHVRLTQNGQAGLTCCLRRAISCDLRSRILRADCLLIS